MLKSTRAENVTCSDTRNRKSCVNSKALNIKLGDEIPEVLVLPVSGNGLVEQLGITLWLCQRGYTPKICFGASGGAIVAALGIVHDWNAENIFKWISKVPSFESFKHHSLGFIEALGNKSSLYNIGPGLEYVFNFIVSPEHEKKLKSNEILILARNKSKGRAEIFSTTVVENSILKSTKGPLHIFGTSCNVEFLGHLTGAAYLQRVKKVIMATSAVPIVFPPVNIDGDYYTDGGCCFSSPLNPIMSLNRSSEIVYILPEDIELDNPSLDNSTLAIGQDFLSAISRANYIHDRSGYLQGLCCGNFDKLKKISGDASTLQKDLKKTEDKKRMVELFPCKQRNLPILSNHDKKDIFIRANEQLDGFRYRIFYME